MSQDNYIATYLSEVKEIAEKIDRSSIEKVLGELKALRERGGRLFILGIGGSAANASHAVNDFRKICGIEAYAPTDNVAELTARTNDEGFEFIFVKWLRTSRLTPLDAILVFSVGGGSEAVSRNIVSALQYAAEIGTPVLGIVGRDGGETKKAGKAVVVIPTVDEKRITPHAEEWQGVVWHLLVNALTR